jgi:hypothetical protein
MSGFPWTSLITAVVPAAAVLAGAALTGWQNNQSGRTTALKADYAAFVQAVTALIESLAGDAYRSDASGPADARQLLSALALARGLVDLAGSYGARRAASDIWHAALGATDARDRTDWLDKTGSDSAEARDQAHTDAARAQDKLRAALEGFLRAVRAEVGGESRPGLKWIIKNWRPRGRPRYAARPAELNDDGL